MKSAYLYLQLMCDLHKTHPDVHKSFQDGLHVVRKSDRYSSRLSTDLVIEQVLMRSLKTSGGLTRGRGMTEAQRLAWVMSMPTCAEVNSAMQNPTDIVNNTSEQHKEATKARQERGHKDAHEIVTFLSLRNRFRADPSLRSITTGIVAEDNVNADKAKEVGEKILSSLRGKNVYDHSSRRKDQVVTMASKAAVKFDDGKIEVDPQLLFQRLSIIATGGRFDNPKSLFKYEMCSYPHALFDTSLLPRKANKPVLVDAIWTDVKIRPLNLQETFILFLMEVPLFIVSHGIAFLHTTPFIPFMFSALSKGMERPRSYSMDIRMGHPPMIVLTKGVQVYPTPTVAFDSSMVAKVKKEEFLASKVNKQKFILHLGERLQQSGCTVNRAAGDAGLLIAQTAIQSARSLSTVLVGDDTDLLVLRCFYAEMDAHDLFFRTEPKQSSKTKRVWNIIETKLAWPLRLQKHFVCSGIAWMRHDF